VTVGPHDGPGSGRPEEQPRTSGDEAASNIEQLRQLGELRQAGVLTEEEFQAKKAELLSGIGTGAKPKRKRRKLTRRTKVLAITVLGLLLAGGGGTAYALQQQAAKEKKERLAAKRKRAEEAREKREAAERAAAAEAEAEAEAEEIQTDFEVSMRKLLIKDLRKSVSKDFKERVADGLLDGPILSTSCDPIEGGVEDLEEETGKFECLVATEKLGGGRVRGYPVDATVNYTKGSYTWQMSN
jgi:hypothetical protein